MALFGWESRRRDGNEFLTSEKIGPKYPQCSQWYSVLLLPAAGPPIHGVVFSDPQLGHFLLMQLTSEMRSNRLTIPILLGICLCSPDYSNRRTCPVQRW